ncbi:DUF6129 family protein [Methylomonas rivi]|uniref:DUF6129 family protein n=1 Tax=Methylomonas rivi TaxID=2952226 RepID=A0ABT1U288_9GAMM|nr:DUF6129 family protein [Methylomonas sp. WSC-6]MBS4051586.1 hypothetical protein [Methylomonas sp.]MCQ8127965.1 DUF6129 family protein [Methylomonas sp. WSC-6]
MISSEQVQRIASAIRTQALSETVVSALRSEYPGIHFTYCMEDDIPTQAPVLEGEGFNLYLVDGRDHCLCLTNNYEHATGIVIAEIIED